MARNSSSRPPVSAITRLAAARTRRVREHVLDLLSSPRRSVRKEDFAEPFHVGPALTTPLPELPVALLAESNLLDLPEAHSSAEAFECVQVAHTNEHVPMAGYVAALVGHGRNRALPLEQPNDKPKLEIRKD